MENANTLYAGELEIRLGEGLVLATGRALTLSVREFELLAAMARRAGAVVTREELFSAVWGGELRHGDRSVDVYVSKLRGSSKRRCPIAASSIPIRASAIAFSHNRRAREGRSFHEMFTSRRPWIKRLGLAAPEGQGPQGHPAVI